LEQTGEKSPRNGSGITDEGNKPSSSSMMMTVFYKGLPLRRQEGVTDQKTASYVRADSKMV
jgi:hypothetical protein